jgi:hypothetical protein
MLEGVNQLIQLRQDFLHLSARGRVRERQTGVAVSDDAVACPQPAVELIAGLTGFIP